MKKNTRLLHRLAQRSKIQKQFDNRARFRHGGGHGESTKWLDRTQDALSVAGMFPGLGIIPDAANTLIGSARTGYNYAVGDTDLAKSQATDTAINAAAMIPVVGQGATAGKFALRTADKVVDAVDATKDLENLYSGVTGSANILSDIKPKQNRSVQSIFNTIPPRQISMLETKNPVGGNIGKYGGIRKYDEGGAIEHEQRGLSTTKPPHSLEPPHNQNTGNTGNTGNDPNLDPNNYNPDGSPKIDIGFSWGNQSGFGPILGRGALGAIGNLDVAGWAGRNWSSFQDDIKGVGDWIGDNLNPFKWEDGGLRKQTGGMYDEPIPKQYQSRSRNSKGGPRKYHAGGSHEWITVDDDHWNQPPHNGNPLEHGQGSTGTGNDPTDSNSPTYMQNTMFGDLSTGTGIVDRTDMLPFGLGNIGGEWGNIRHYGLLDQVLPEGKFKDTNRRVHKVARNVLNPMGRIFGSVGDSGSLASEGVAAGKRAWEGVRGLFKEEGGPRRQTGGMYDQMRRYQQGGQTVPGGMVASIPGSDAIEFMGNKHDESGGGSDSGIILDDNTEVEDGETMDQVTMAQKGGKRKDYFFSDHLKKGGKSYAEHHKDILRDGGNQEDIDYLARMQEHAAGRSTAKIASTGGSRYKKGGAKEEALKIEGAQEIDGVVYDKDGRVLYQDINMDGIDDQTQGLTTYHNTPNDVTRTILENSDIADAVSEHEKATNTTLDKETNKFVSNEESIDDEGSSEKSTSTSKDSETKKKGLSVASDIYLSDYGDIPGVQPGKKIGDMQYYLDDEELQKYITGHENFGEEWMNNIDPSVLEAAGITDFSQMNDPKFVTAYQKAWNAKYKDNQIQVDGDFGEQTIRTGYKDDPEEEPDKDSTPTKDPDKIIDTPLDIVEKKKKRKLNLTGLAQFLPAAMAFLEKPDTMQKADLVKPSAIIPERMAKVRLERVDYNDQLARNAADANALNRFIETSGGGPASMVNRMAAYSKKQDADMKVKADETRANAAIGNQEAALEAQRRAGNVSNALSASEATASSQQTASIHNAKNKMTVDEFNAAAKAATKDRRLMAVDNAVKGLAQMRSDRLQYEGQERLASAISGQTGVYDREAYGQDLIAAGYKAGDSDYNALMKQYNLRNKPVIPPKKEEKKEESTLARMGGYRKKIRRYGK